MCIFTFVSSTNEIPQSNDATETEILQVDDTKSEQIKPKLSAWLCTSTAKSRNVFFAIWVICYCNKSAPRELNEAQP